MSTSENIELTKSYIAEALFALMEQMPFEKISISDIAKKAGVGRATFYRHFKTKEDVVRDYFAAETKEFLKASFTEARTRDDFYELIFTAFTQLKQEKLAFKRLIAAGMEKFYYEYTTEKLLLNFSEHNYSDFPYAPYHIAGSLCTVSLAWVRRDCAESVRVMTEGYLRLILPEGVESVP